jgi:hypothetical protein
LIRKKITVRLVFGAVQTLLAFLAIVLALFLKFDAFDFQSSMNIPKDALNFYVVMLLALGFISVIGGLFLVYDWWESW